MRLIPFATPVLFFVGTTGLAQPVEEQGHNTCLFVGESYSPGATIRAGNQVMVCTSDAVWELSESWAAGCFFGGDFYSVGSVNKGSAKGDVRTVCLKDGTWERLDPKGVGAGGCFSNDKFFSVGDIVGDEEKARCMEDGTWETSDTRP